MKRQKAHKTPKSKGSVGGGQQGNGPKRVRRKAPPFTLVWSEEVRALRSLSTKEVVELRTKALWRIELAEAALSSDPAVARLGGKAQAGDVIWSKFRVGAHWFCLDFRPAKIREYVVNLASPPSPDDAPPTDGDRSSITVRRDAFGGGSGPEDGEGSTSALSRISDWARERAITVWRMMRLTLRDAKLAARDITVQSTIMHVISAHRIAYRKVSYTLTNLRASVRQISRRLISTLATGRISFTRMRELSASQLGAEGRLEPRWINQTGGAPVLLYSWTWNEPPQIDWNADLFGILPIDWAANLFGVAEEEERAFR